MPQVKKWENSSFGLDSATYMHEVEINGELAFWLPNFSYSSKKSQLPIMSYQRA